MMTIKETILEQMIIEGVDDPGILKCVFMAGGPETLVNHLLPWKFSVLIRNSNHPFHHSD